MKEIIDSLRESSENDVVCAVQGTYKHRREIMKKFEKDKATEKSLNWGIVQVESGVGKYFNWEEAENSLQEMAKIANQLADMCKQAGDSQK